MLTCLNELGSILSLLQIQNTCIKQIDKSIYTLYSDLQLINQRAFEEFISHFTVFRQNHFISFGFTKALDALQVCQYTLLEQLLNNQVMAAAEELETALTNLEIVWHQPEIRVNVQALLLGQAINNLEENLLKIIEELEILLQKCGKAQFEN